MFLEEIVDFSKGARDECPYCGNERLGEIHGKVTLLHGTNLEEIVICKEEQHRKRLHREYRPF